MKLYRAMKVDADGLPVVEPSARGLGVRAADKAPHNDVQAASADDDVGPGTGGMSVAPNDPANLPVNRRPAALGGFGKDPVWEIEDTELGADLSVRQDTQTHSLVDVARTMTLAEYEAALAATRDQWRRVNG